MKELLRQKKQEEKRIKRQGKDRDFAETGEAPESVESPEGGEQPTEAE